MYTREQKDYYIDLGAAPGSGYNFVITAAEVKLQSDRLGIQFETNREKSIGYSVLLGAYHLQSKMDLNNDNIFVSPVSSQQFFPQPGWSGGLTLQFRLKKFTAGVNCLYYFDKHSWTSENANGFPPVLEKLSSIVLQHIYAGYQFKHFEAYLSGRNLFRQNRLALNDDITYIGGGLKTRF